MLRDALLRNAAQDEVGRCLLQISPYCPATLMGMSAEVQLRTCASRTLAKDEFLSTDICTEPHLKSSTTTTHAVDQGHVTADCVTEQVGGAGTETAPPSVGPAA
jgi:hypothetical protein